MTNKSRSFLRVSVVPALLLGGVCATVQAAPTNWSDPATWPNKQGASRRRQGHHRRGKEVILDVSPPALGGITDQRQAQLRRTTRPGTDHRVDHGARRVADRHRSQALHSTRPPSPSPTTSRTKTSWRHGRPRHHALGRHAEPAWQPHQHLDQAGEHRRGRQHLDRSAECRAAGASATKSSWPRRISIPARPSGARSPPSAATRSRSTRSSTTCTSARSPSTWMSAAKSAC